MLIRQFLSYMRYERNKSPLTVHSYEQDLRAFDAYVRSIDESLSIGTADADIIRDWMEDMVDKGQKATSVNRRLSALHSFYRYALARGIVEKDPSQALRGPKREKPLPQFLRESEMDELIDRMTRKVDSYKDVRARTIIILLYETGIRVAELVNIDDDAVDMASGSISVKGKGGKQRIIPFADELRDTLQMYMSRRNEEITKRCGALLLTTKGGRMSTDQVRYIVKKYVSCVSSLKKKTPHVLRHTFATAMLNHGASIGSIQKLLGHASVKTTEIYTHTTFEQLERAYKQAHPRA